MRLVLHLKEVKLALHLELVPLALNLVLMLGILYTFQPDSAGITFERG